MLLDSSNHTSASGELIQIGTVPRFFILISEDNHNSPHPRIHVTLLNIYEDRSVHKDYKEISLT